MAEASSFEIVGCVSPQAVGTLNPICEALVSHEWGGESIDVLLCGDLLPLLKEHMPATRFSKWQAGYEGGRVAGTAAISFVTEDGRRAAAVPALDDAMLVMLAAHEMVEAALERRHDAERHVFKEQTHTSLAHVLWTEYVVERTRRQLFDRLALGYSALEEAHLHDQADDFSRELPSLIRWAVRNDDLPPRVVQLWYELARVFSMSLGRADEHSPSDVDGLELFRVQPTINESAAGWDSLTESLRHAFGQPGTAASVLDADVRDNGWMPLYEGGLGGVWNPRYAAAGGSRP